MPKKNENLFAAGARRAPSRYEGGFAAALRRRLYPHTQIHPKQLAHALAPDPSPETVENVLRSLYHHAAGASRPSDAAARLYVAFFVACGDYGFVAEVYPGAEPLVRKARAVDAALEAMGPGQAGGRADRRTRGAA